MRSTDQRFELQTAVELARFSTLGIGGPARWFATAYDPGTVARAHDWAAGHGVEMFILGGGSNIVVSDHGVNALVLHVALTGVTIEQVGTDTIVRAAAGEPWDPLVESTVARGLCGLECLSGIPGSVGGTPVQNVGAYGQEVAHTIDEVAAFDRISGRMTALAASDCSFSYRMSRFKQGDAGRFVICGVTFRLRTGAPTVGYPDVVRQLDERGVASPGVADVRAAVLAVRRSKGMVIDSADADTRSVGSFFMNPIVSAKVHADLVSAHEGQGVPGFELPDGSMKVPAAWLIERAGFGRGYQDGAVGLSSKHPLALVNRGSATARDVLRLATRIKRQVADRFGVHLHPEPVFVGFTDEPEIAFLTSH